MDGKLRDDIKTMNAGERAVCQLIRGSILRSQGERRAGAAEFAAAAKQAAAALEAKGDAKAEGKGEGKAAETGPEAGSAAWCKAKLAEAEQVFLKLDALSEKDVGDEK